MLADLDLLRRAVFCSADYGYDERDVCLDLIDRRVRHGPLIVIGDRGYTGRDFAGQMRQRHAIIVGPVARRSPATDRTWPRSANASRASSGPSRIS